MQPNGLNKIIICLFYLKVTVGYINVIGGCSGGEHYHFYHLINLCTINVRSYFEKIRPSGTENVYVPYILYLVTHFSIPNVDISSYLPYTLLHSTYYCGCGCHLIQ